MLDQYVRFFAECTTASAGFTGLLFVALSVANHDESQHETRERRTVLAASAFLALIDIFFVSLLSSLGSTAVLATSSLVMAVVGLLGTSRLLPRAKRAGRFGRGVPKRDSISPSPRLPLASIRYRPFSQPRCSSTRTVPH